jgi:hypothetical protein
MSPDLSQDGKCGDEKDYWGKRLGVEGPTGPLHLGKVNYSRGFEIVLTRVNNPGAQVISKFGAFVLFGLAVG